MITYTVEYNGKIEVDAENIDQLDEELHNTFRGKGLEHWEIVEQSDDW